MNKTATPAVFNFENFHIEEAKLSFNNVTKETKLTPIFDVSGEYSQVKSVFTLHIGFKAVTKDENREEDIVSLHCMATFHFKETIELTNIPDYFYPNSIAIVFPYIRAFISTLFLQANYMPLVLPTMNLSGLQGELKENTKAV